MDPFCNRKIITMLEGDDTYHATITSIMAEGDEIYNALRGAFFGKIGPGLSIIIYHPTRDEKVRLHYPSLKEGQTYRIATATERQQGVGSAASGGTQKTLRHIAVIQEHWKLADASHIVPYEIAPRLPDELGRLPIASMGEGGVLQDPHLWPARLADELRKLSGRSVDRQAVAIQYLTAAVQARHERDDSGLWQMTSGDIKDAVRRMTESIADQAYGELPEEKAYTETYAGGLAEAAMQALDEADGESANMGSGYEQDGKFTISMR
ncbi:uncharacterized protein K460DRAFT_365670 [Cucurbitaria berberidis CBS 394.84]|uniref:Uncharacterized protein n=1 Tax=Cucurbitaria berberidis CBS 394.84 TaxID=1168544 RepID=A0A9P4GFW7_9PLEO|nr:uncharacterized protein K460DRAFT_365670 [Cucurbitaria berberidis CBS 394.84]KAF1844726.1 hypothetical protein K460DRAFT_365670 [Cucurbitaria berberidis CBS 394.84]